jgi:hypothetical protein
MKTAVFWDLMQRIWHTNIPAELPASMSYIPEL